MTRCLTKEKRYMDEFIQGVKEVWNNHYMLILFIVLDVVYAVVGKISVKKNKENADYYFGKNVEKRSNPLREETSVSDFNDYYMYSYNFIYICNYICNICYRGSKDSMRGRVVIHK